MITKTLLFLVLVLITTTITNSYFTSHYSPIFAQKQQNQPVAPNNNTQNGSNNSNQQLPNDVQQAPTQTSEQDNYNSAVTKILNQMNAPLNKTLPQSITTSLGTEPENKDNWIMANHDIYNTRSSNQTIIGKDNVANLQVKWVFSDSAGIE